MKISSVFILLCTLRLSRGAYQVGKESRAFKQAVEKVTKSKVAVIAPESLDTLSSSGYTLPSGVARWKHQGPPLYWYHTQIHSLGNTGLFGALHSALCPLATYIIDVAAYSGENIRNQVAKELRRVVTKPRPRIADLCCGVGFSTRALQDYFPTADILVGIDTSPEMISVARLFTAESLLGKVANWHQKMASEFSQSFNLEDMRDTVFPSRFPLYHLANAENTPFPGRTFDLVTIMYAFHEAPLLGRYRILREVRRLLAEGGTLAVVDISPSYTPSPAMLAGEPYVLEYKDNIQKQLSSIRGFANISYKELVPNHVGMWMLTRKVSTPISKFAKRRAPGWSRNRAFQ